MYVAYHVLIIILIVFFVYKGLSSIRKAGKDITYISDLEKDEEAAAFVSGGRKKIKRYLGKKKKHTTRLRVTGYIYLSLSIFFAVIALGTLFL